MEKRNNTLMNGCLVALTALGLSATPALAQQPSTAQAQPSTVEKGFDKSTAVASHGFLSNYQKEGRYYLEIPDSVFGRDILVTITITKGAYRKERKDDERFGFAGDSMFSKMIRFVKTGDTVSLVYPSVTYHNANPDNLGHLATDLPPIHASFNVTASENGADIIDITDMIKSDDELFSLRGGANDLHLGAAQSQHTQVESIHAFPRNINFLSLRSYTLNRPVKDENTNSRWEVSSSWFLLPKTPMTPRISDKRVGYFAYGLPGLTYAQGYDLGSMAIRWRLEPKDEDMEKYRNGELIEPKKPIVYYISRTVPEYLRPYFIQAVNNWEPAFRAAGFKNAIHAEIAPNDSLYDEGDVRYPLVSYKASPIPNAYGPSVVDPRSGEIITSHIGIYHSVLDLIQRWYFVMCAQVDQRARQYPLDKKIIGKLMETVLTHEVGHTLGLRHNFIASTIYDADSLRNEEFVREHGLGGSIMDYQRFNYLLQPGDKITDYDNLLPHVGDYDKFAIKWGYSLDPTSSLEENTKARRQWVTDMRAKHNWAKYIEETTLGDPRVQSEDSGSDDIKSNTYGMKNLQYIMNHLEEWTNTPDNDWYPLRRRYLSIQNQYWNYIGHVVRYVAGVMDDKCDNGEQLYTNQPISRDDQLRALHFINEYMIKDQKWLWRPELMKKTGVDWSYDLERSSRQIGVLFLKFMAIANQNEGHGGLSANDVFDYIYDKVYAQYPAGRKLSIHERMLQRNLLSDITVNAENPATFGIGVGLQLKKMLEKIKAYAEQGEKQTQDDITKAHFATIVNFITTWQTGDNKGLLTK